MESKSKKTVLWKLFLSTFYLSAFTFGGGYVIVSLMKKKFVAVALSAVCLLSAVGCGQQSACLVQCSLPGVVVLVGLFKISHGSDSFHSLRELHQFTWVTVTSSRLRLTSSALSASSR